MIEIVAHGIDTMEISFQGEVREHNLALIDELKQRAQDKNKPQKISLPYSVKSDRCYEEFLVYSTGSSMYRYLLEGSDFDLKISPSSSIPAVKVRIRSIALHKTSHMDILKKISLIAEELGGFMHPKISRLDIYADFQGWIPSLDEFYLFKSNSIKSSWHFESRELSYLNFGKTPLMIRIYDKSQEIKISNKEWFYDIWEASSYYDQKRPVWRLEGQISREKLKEFGINTPQEALESLRPLWQICLTTTELKQDTKNKQRCRRPTDPKWQKLYEIEFTGNRLLKRPIRKDKSMERIIRGYGGYLTSYAAMIDCVDPLEATQKALTYYEHHLRSKGQNFSEVVKDKMDSTLQTKER